ncbi:hypothetical protein CDA63_18940 [Hymenobacter amundsenii]|uniref:Uncharacterized protein n=1 Tax=Hymenobacter amundsenii TaxID=2006685 RepID=A0A246FG95_9BACT|nr:hypothetical protein [Hymenobacter amundsenii]OWP61541.1 hypothetical protein CDA63_18940 [Hymenobacter amundsenii]
MKLVYNVLLLSVQAGTTFVVLLGVYLLLALLDYRGGLDGLIGLVAFQPLMGALLSLATISLCVLVGLPLRLAAFGRWWRQRTFLALGGAAASVALLVLSLFMQGGTVPATFTEPSVLVLAGCGWFLLAFCLLHVFPPDTLLHRVGLFRTRYSK